ncbi:MAG: S8 family serine peptidase [Bacteroidota bacterium]|nr:S8 family serine peptidase [Bacteroidota bacterium]
MNNTIRIFVSLLLFSSLGLKAQTTDYWVFLENKNTADYSIESDFTEKAIARRNLQNIEFDASDYPVNGIYQDQISAIVTELVGASRWFNAAYVKATEEEIVKLTDLDFIRRIENALVPETSPFCDFETASDELSSLESLMITQLAMFYPNHFEEAGLTGKGVRIAVLDGGFPGVETHAAFEHIRKENRIIDTYDFVKDEPNSYRGIQHGTMVLSNIAGKYNDKLLGLAPDAEFLLARTEKRTEPYKEEIYWMQAMEWADRKGADIINSSLGYTYHRYFQEDMDGKTSLVSQAANKAAEKGILVVNAAGNDGSSDWHYIGTPADADSILSIGGVNPDTYLHISFSSFGPTADGKMKPNLCASGKAVVANKKGDYGISHGTSFASPLAAGFAACAKQAFPELSVMELKAKIESAGSLYPYFDYAHGYGIPDAGKLLDKKSVEKTINIIDDDNEVVIRITDEVFKSLSVHDKSRLFYHIQDETGILTKYKVLEVQQQVPLSLSKENLKGKTLMLHYRGYSKSVAF